MDSSRKRWLLAGLAAVPAVYLLAPKRRSKQDYDTGFDSFLKEQVAEEEQGFTFDSFLKVNNQQDSCSFDSFLKNAGAAAPSAPASGAKPASTATVSAEDVADKIRVVVMFGTEYGFAKEIAE